MITYSSEPEPTEPTGPPDDWYHTDDAWPDSPCSWPIEDDEEGEDYDEEDEEEVEVADD
jgi:hypothetical protein